VVRLKETEESLHVDFSGEPAGGVSLEVRGKGKERPVAVKISV